MIPFTALCLGLLIGYALRGWTDRKHAWGTLPPGQAFESFKPHFLQPDDPGTREW